jgi:hypothetical protein
MRHDPTATETRSGRRLAIPLGVALLGAAVLALPAREVSAQGGPGKAWKSAAQRMLAAELDGAKADLNLALARAYTQATEEARNQDARDEFRDAKDVAKQAHRARLDLATELGEEAPYRVAINPADFVAGVNNPLMPLVPGTTLVYRTVTAEGTEIDTVEVTSDTKQILGVTCMVVHDSVALDGVLVEDTLDYFAQDTAGNVWYFGEQSLSYENARLVSIEGSWEAGADGAQPGIVMEAAPALGDHYRQEFLLGVAEDFGRVVSLSETVTVPAGTYSDCLKTEDGTPLEPDVLENKYFASGVGTVLEVDQETGDRTELIEIR